MKVCLMLVLACTLTGCVTDVSQDPPHNKLAGTVWRLKADAYVIRFNDQKKQLYIIPNTKEFGTYLRDYSDIEGKPYDEKNIGRKIVGERIVGGLRAGESLKVLRVLKVPHIEMGTRYVPVMAPEQRNKWTGDKELNGYKLYRGRDENGLLFYDRGILNPEYAEIVAAETNASSAAGSSSP